MVVTNVELNTSRMEGNSGLVTITKASISRYTLQAFNNSPIFTGFASAGRSLFTNFAITTMATMDRRLPIMAGDSAPINTAAEYCPPSDTTPVTADSTMFFNKASRRMSAIYTIIKGMININGASCNTTLAESVFTSRPVSLASTITGVPMAPKVVATLLAIRHTTAENTGL